MIIAQDLGKRYRRKVAVDDISFEVKTGRVTGFLGPNGAGKSTTMRLMLGLDKGSGTTTFDGKTLQQYPQPTKVVGILLEAKAFHPTRTARNHLAVLAEAGNIPMERIDEALDVVGLINEANRGPGKFSLGMAQRLGLAAAILGKPKYLILDEPANGLDPEGIAWLRQFLKDYADAGNAVFVSSHLLSEMSQMADDIIVIGKGKLIASTSMATLLSENAHSGVFVRTPQLTALKQALTRLHMTFDEADGGLKVFGAKTDAIGKIAYNAKIQLSELSNRSASLEEAFLELTSSAVEYTAHEEKQP